MHHTEVDVDLVMYQFGSKAIGETANRVLRAAVGRLQRDASICERGTYLDDCAAISWNHKFQCCHRSIYSPEIGDLCYTPEFISFHLLKGREHRDHCIVDPDVDRTEFTFN